MDNNRSEQHTQLIDVAKDVMRLSRDTLLVNLRFLDAALDGLAPEPQQNGSLMTDGRRIIFDVLFVLRSYMEERERPVRDYLHMTLHCIFRHNFVDAMLNQDCWDLACDIAVENIINDLDIPSAKAKRATEQAVILAQLKKQLKQSTAEHIYRYYCDCSLSPQKIAEIRKNFLADNHALWYMPPQDSQSASDEGASDNSDSNEDNAISSDSESTRAKLEQRWKDISDRMQIDMDRFSKQRGDRCGSLKQNLREVNREKYDYTSFLKKFSTLGETMKINDDEFDYIFYTYGMKLYGKMPLIEPLEYKEVKKIRELVIAIDTSGSVSGELVQRFIQKTYNILKTLESFFAKFKLHIIQCDTEIQEDAVITSQEDFDRYLKTMKLRGFGGTDFRPVFSYVEQLREKREFTNLKGLIYFTDGYGVFPEKKPDYNTAFVFVDDEYNDFDVPAWAIKLVLQSDEI